MTSFIDADLAYMASDVLSVPVVFGAQRTSGFLDEMDHVTMGGFGEAGQVKKKLLTIQRSSLTGLAIDAQITVDGVLCTIRDFPPIDDGKMLAVLVAERR